MRRRVFEILSNPRHEDRLGRAIQAGLLLLIALNVITSILETDKEIARSAAAVFRWFEIVSVTLFTIEYVLRLWSCTASPAFRRPIAGRLKHALRPMSLVDLAAIAPFFLELFIPGVLDLRFLRVLRLMRLFRLFRVGPVSDGFGKLVQIVQAKRAELFVSMSVVVAAMILSAGVIYLVEHDVPGSPFTSIPRAMWWSIVTITTVGYGDITPLTPLGKAVGGVVAVIGICSLALPVGIISSGYVEELNKSREGSNQPSSSACPHCGGHIDR